MRTAEAEVCKPLWSISLGDWGFEEAASRLPTFIAPLRIAATFCRFSSVRILESRIAPPNEPRSSPRGDQSFGNSHFVVYRYFMCSFARNNRSTKVFFGSSFAGAIEPRQ